MNNKSGFTLIELLAIIVIIAIIAVITIPQISNVIEDSKKNAAKDSAYGYKNAVHQFYLSESTSNEELDMDGSYSIENGKITDGANTFNISASGTIPESGELIIENGEIVDGCINYGKYSVTITNGEVSQATENGCYNYSYFTYDDNSETNTTTKVSEPNSNWQFYIKETEIAGKYRYGIVNKNNNEIFSSVTFLSLKKCQTILNEEQGQGDILQYECRELGNEKNYEICGIENNTTFCLKLGETNYETNINILNDIFEECTSLNSSFYCDGNNINVDITEDNIRMTRTSDQKSCNISLYYYEPGDKVIAYSCGTNPGRK